MRPGISPGFSRSGIIVHRRIRSGCLCVLSLMLRMPEARAAPPDLGGVVYEQRLGAALPMMRHFREQDGRGVRLGEVMRDRPTVLALGYFACPSLCGLIRDDLFAALAQSGLRAATDYQLVFLSIDAAETASDAAAARRADLREHPSPGAEAGWHFLTGGQGDIAAVEQAVGYRSRYDLSLKQFIHPAGLVFVTPGGKVSGYLLGVGYAPGEVRAGLVRARDGGIARAALPILLVCFHYDSTTGRYSLAVVKLLRLAGGLTVATIAVLLLLLRRRAGGSADQRVR